MPDREPNLELARDWLILLGCSLCATISITGLNSYSAGTLLATLHETLGWSLESLTAVQMATMAIVAVGAPIAGVLLDKFGALPVIVCSLIAEAAAYAALGFMPPIFELYAALNFVLVAGGVGTTAPSVLRIVTATFKQKRGLALGIVIGAMGVMAIIVPLALSRVIDATNWRGAYFVLAGWALIAGLAAVVLIRLGEKSRSARREKLAAVSNAEASAAEESAQLIKQPFTSPLFWLLLAAFMLPPLLSNGYLTLLTSILRERGVSLQSAGNIQALMGVAMLLARLCSGALMDIIKAQWVAAATFALTGFGCLVLLYGGASLTPVAAMLLGLTVGAEMDIMAYIAARYFGVKRFGKVYGLYFGVLVVAGGSSPFVLMMIKKFAGGLEAMIIASVAGALIGSFLILIAGRMGDRILSAGGARPGDALSHAL